VETKGVKADPDAIKSTWFPVYRKLFLRKSLEKTYECKKGYWIYSKGVEGEVMRKDLYFPFLMSS